MLIYIYIYLFDILDTSDIGGYIWMYVRYFVSFDICDIGWEYVDIFDIL